MRQCTASGPPWQAPTGRLSTPSPAVGRRRGDAMNANQRLLGRLVGSRLPTRCTSGRRDASQGIALETPDAGLRPGSAGNRAISGWQSATSPSNSHRRITVSPRPLGSRTVDVFRLLRARQDGSFEQNCGGRRPPAPKADQGHPTMNGGVRQTTRHRICRRLFGPNHHLARNGTIARHRLVAGRSTSPILIARYPDAARICGLQEKATLCSPFGDKKFIQSSNRGTGAGLSMTAKALWTNTR